ncbi:S-layer homology domain-containing protein [Paenibacillus sp. CF384]|nr:S-layer homology domain-containing protein [Paenibacillus sp. CF384]
MKKSLSLLVAAAMTLSTASVAFAADGATTTELSTQAKFDALKAAGIFNGFPDGSAGLDKEMTRAEFAKVLTKLSELAENSAANVYSDVAKTHWAAGFIGAASEAGLLNGLGGGKFGPSGKVTIEQIAKVADLVAGVEPSDKEVTGKVSAWAKGFVAAAIEAGLLPELPSYQVNATRGQLVDVAYDLAQPEDATLAATAKVAGAKKIDVALNKVSDKATFEVKNASGTVVNVKEVTFSTDKKTATLAFASNLVKGEYTINVKNGEETASAKVTAEDEKVTKIEFASDKAVIDRADASAKTVYTTVKVLNQYGEDVTSTKAGSVTVTAGKGTAALNTNGSLVLTAGAVFAKDEKVAVSALDASSNTFASAVLTVVDKAAVAELTIDKLYNADGKTLSKNENDSQNWVLIVTGKDQYGNSISKPEYFENDVLVSASNPSVSGVLTKVVDAVTVADFGTTTIDGTTYVSLPVQLPETAGVSTALAGTSKITMISKTTGKNTSFDVAVKDTVKVDTLTASAPALAVAGETVDIPFTAVDQFGAAVTNAADLIAGVTSKSVTGGGTINFVQDYVKNTAKLQVSGLAEGTAIVTIITGTNKVTQLTINVQATAKPVVVSAIKDFNKNFATGATATLTKDNVVAKDQYGRDIATTGYKVYVSTSDAAKVKLTGTAVGDTGFFDLTAANVTVGALAKGSSTVTLKLVTAAGADVTNSEYTYTSKVVEKADVASYELADIGTVYHSATENAAYAKDITVNGVLADGTKVAVPATWFNVEDTDANVEVDGNKIRAFGPVAGFTDGAKDVTVTAVVEGATGPVVLTKVAKVTTAAPSVSTLEVVESGAFIKEDTNVISASVASVNDATKVNTLVNAVVKAVDQYGVELTGASEPAYKNYITNVTDGKAITAVAAGNTFQVTTVVGGKTISFKVIVKA